MVVRVVASIGGSVFFASSSEWLYRHSLVIVASYPSLISSWFCHQLLWPLEDCMMWVDLVGGSFLLLHWLEFLFWSIGMWSRVKKSITNTLNYSHWVNKPDKYWAYSEKIVYLPHSYQVNDRQRVISDKVYTRAELGLPEQGFVSCCFNNNFKILPDIFDLWICFPTTPIPLPVTPFGLGYPS